MRARFCGRVSRTSPRRREKRVDSIKSAHPPLSRSLAARGASHPDDGRCRTVYNPITKIRRTFYRRSASIDVTLSLAAYC